MQFVFMVGSFFLSLLLLTIVGSARTIRVDDDEGADYSNIQEAIDAAEVGDTIRVYDGTYYENIVMNKTVSLIGNGSTTTTIDGGGNGDVIQITANWMNISGFNITNAGTGAGDYGIWIISSNNSIFDNSFSFNRDGIHLNGYGGQCNFNRLINNCFFKNGKNSISGSIANHTIFQNNLCDDPIGMTFDASSYMIIINNIIENNNYGIKIFGSSAGTCNSNLIENNSISSKHIGISFWEATNITISNNSITTCTTGISGYLYFSAKICGNFIMNNSEGIKIQIAKYNLIVNNTIFQNTVGIIIQKWWTGDPSTDNTIYHNNIYNNTEYGINATDNAGYETDATNNWWGDPSGPYHPSDNPDGKGDNVTDFVLFDPWISSPSDYFAPEAIIDSVTPGLALEGEEIHFLGQGKAYNSITRYIWSSSINGELYNGSSPSFSLSYLSNGSHTIFLTVLDDFGVYSDEVSVAITANGRPVGEITVISPNPVKKNQIISFTAEGRDDGSIERYVWRSDLDGPLYNGSNTVFTLSSLSVGNHTIYLKVLDDLDAWSHEVNISLTVLPNKIPVISITSPGEGNTVKGTVTVEGMASDEDGTIEKVEISIDGVTWLPTSGTESWSYVLKTEELENGKITIKTRSHDGENYSEEKSITVTVENIKEGGGDDGFLPGFGILNLLVVFVICAVLRSWKKQTKQ
jgi:parallel beta-helix repeat protein